MAVLMILSVVAGVAWLAIPSAVALVALAGGAVVLELRARRDADVILHAEPLTGPPADAETSAVLRRRAAALTAPKHVRALAEAVRAYAHGRRHLLVPPPPAARLFSRHVDAAERIATALDNQAADARAVVELEWLLMDPRPSEDRLWRVERLLLAA
jgi:hypothetical protein